MESDLAWNNNKKQVAQFILLGLLPKYKRNGGIKKNQFLFLSLSQFSPLSTPHPTICLWEINGLLTVLHAFPQVIFISLCF